MAHVDLLELPYFEGIGIDALVALVDLLTPRHLACGEVLMAEGDRTPQSLYIATSGRVGIGKRAAGAAASRQLAELQAPTLVGELELFCQVPPVATVTALTELHGFELSRSVFEALLRGRHPAITMFCFNVARVACHRLAVADEVMAGLVGSEDLVVLRGAISARSGGGSGDAGLPGGALAPPRTAG